jgi:hypothetical protein
LNTNPNSKNQSRLLWVTPWLLVACACLFNLVAYHSELTIDAPHVNDHILHSALITEMNQAWEAGENPRDAWIPFWGQGFPVLRYYQHLPHYLVVVAHHLSFKTIPLDTLFRFANLLLLTVFPLSVYAGSRWLGLSRFSAACVAILAPFIDADPQQRHYLGLQARNYIWMGGGLFPQLAAMVLFPLALGRLRVTINSGRGYALSLALLLALWLSHLLFGYIACLLGVLFLLPYALPGLRGRAIARLLILYGLTALAASYILLPTLLESQLLSKSVWEPSVYWDSYGAMQVMRDLFTGLLLDGRHFPAISLLCLAGALLAAWRIRSDHKGAGTEVLLLAFFTVSVLLFFGRPFWGSWLSLLPFSEKLPWHRMIIAVQFSGLFLAGYGLCGWWKLALRYGGPRLALVPLIGSVLLFYPGVTAVWHSAMDNQELRARSLDDYRVNGPFLEQQMTVWQEQNRSHPGRGYAGTSWDWGKDYKLSDVPIYGYWARFGIPAISYMMHSMGLNSDLEVSFDPSRRDHYDLFNVRYLMAYDASYLPGFAGDRTQLPGIHAATVDTPGYFDLVQSDAFFSLANSDQAGLYALNQEYLASAHHKHKRHFRVGWQGGDQAEGDEQEISAGQSLDQLNWASQGPPGAVLFSTEQDGRYSARISTQEAAYALFRMTFHSNWRASVDGRPVATVMLSPSYIGIPLPAGEHLVELRYRSPWWTAGLFWFGLLLIPLTYALEKSGVGARVLTAFAQFLSPLSSPLYWLSDIGRRLVERITGSPECAVGWALFGCFFLLSRIWMLFTPYPPWSDVTLYFQNYQQFLALDGNVFEYFSRHTFPYPPILLIWMLIPGWATSLFGAVTEVSYLQSFKFILFLFDFSMLLILPSFIRSSLPGISSRELLMRLFVYLPMLPLLTGLSYYRLDLIVTFVMLAGLLLAGMGRPRPAALVLGLAGAFKIFPLLLAGPLLIWIIAQDRQNGTWRYLSVIACAVLGIALGVLPFFLLFGAESLQFLSYQSARGLQIESIPASLGMLANFGGLELHAYVEAMATSLAFAGSKALQHIWSLLGVAFFLAMLAMCWLKQQRLADPHNGFGLAIAWSTTFLMAGMVFSNVFSPQFLILFFPLIVALPVTGVRFRIIAGLFLLLLAFTDAIFPNHYLDLVNLLPSGIALLLVRNALFLTVFFLLLLWGLRKNSIE